MIELIYHKDKFTPAERIMDADRNACRGISVPCQRSVKCEVKKGALRSIEEKSQRGRFSEAQN